MLLTVTVLGSACSWLLHVNTYVPHKMCVSEHFALK